MKNIRSCSQFAIVLLLLSIPFCLATITASAQEVVVAYNDDAGTIVRYRVLDGGEIARIHQVYRVGTNVFRPTAIAVDASAYYVLFGSRYLARLRPSDAAIQWVIDAANQVPSAPGTVWNVADIAAAGGSVFVVNYDPGRRIAKYRASDGLFQGAGNFGIQVGLFKQLPFKLAATDNGSFFSLMGFYFLNKMSQTDFVSLTINGDGHSIWVRNIPATTLYTTWEFADLTAGGGFEYVSYRDPLCTLRKYDDSGMLVWEQTRLSRLLLGSLNKMAASGFDSIMIVFGDRTLARMRTLDGQIVWYKDVSLASPGYLRWVPSDLAAIGAP